MLVKQWNKRLTRENFDSFYMEFSPSAFKSTYRMVGDTTRTERVLVESFVALYQKRRAISPDELPLCLGNLLQEKIERQTEAFSVRETERATARTLDEFTQSSMLMEIHKQIDSVLFRLLEMFSGGFAASENGNGNGRKDKSLLRILRDTGLSLFALVQFLILAILIYMITTVTAMTFISRYDGIPSSPDSATFSVSDLFMNAKQFFPLRRPEPVSSPEPENPADTQSPDDGTDASETPDDGTGAV